MNRYRTKEYLKHSDFWVRLSLTIFIVALAAFIFLFFGGINLYDSYKADKRAAFSNFSVHYIDVGQGDSSLICLPSGETILIDCGEAKESEKLVNYIGSVFKSRGFTAIDYLILTHQDADHIGGAKKVLESFQVKNVYRPKENSIYENENGKGNTSYKNSNSVTYSDTIKAVYEEPGCNIYYSEEGLRLFASSYSFIFLSPSDVTFSSENNYSPIMKLTCLGKSFVFTGDAEKSVENATAAKYAGQLSCDVYQVGHHGSNTSTSDEFLAALSPEYSVISVARKNKYGLPSSETISKLKKANSKILYTYDGSIELSVDATGEIIFALRGNMADLTIVIAIAIVLLLLIWGIKKNPLKSILAKKANKNKSTKKQSKGVKKNRSSS